jgi:heat shock protein HslJ
MACIEGMELEQRFLGALSRTTRFSIQGNSLALYSGDEQPRMRFVAVALRQGSFALFRSELPDPSAAG